MMKTRINKSKISTIALVLVLTVAALMAGLPVTTAQTSIQMRVAVEPIIGVNTPTMINFIPTVAMGYPPILGPNPFRSPPYEVQNWTETPMWPDATITFTRPDASQIVKNGPFIVYAAMGDGYVAFEPRIELVFTPDMMGVWTVEFQWPGDGTYEAITSVDTFTVREHIPMRETFAMLSLRPYPAVGLLQPILVNAWVTPPPETPDNNFRDFVFTIMRPDDSIYHIFTTDSEAPGVVWFEIMLDTLGDWTFKFEFPGDYRSNPCSITRTITVQQDPIPYPIEDTPLPTGEWAYPINVYNREWRNIAGPWYMSYYNASKGSFNPYTEAPRSAHILWKLPPVSGLGGYIGATDALPGITTDSIYSSTPPEGLGMGGIFGGEGISTVFAGRGYYMGGGMIHCLDMRTGEELWSEPGGFDVGALRSGQPVLYDFAPTFRVYDALTGEMTLDVPSMAMIAFDDPYVYSTTGITFSPSSFGRFPETTNLVKWTTEGTTDDFTQRIMWNITLPVQWFTAYTALHEGIFISQKGVDAQLVEGHYGVDVTTGEIMYNTTTSMADQSEWLYSQGPAAGSGFGLFYHAGVPIQNEGLGYVAYDMSTGEVAWISEETEYPWGNFWAYIPQASAYNMIYGLSYSGVYAFNATNGKIVWHYSAGDAGMETPYNTWSYGSVGPVIGGGIVFAPNTEHSPTLYYRGEQLHAIDAFTGDKVWSIMGNYRPSAIAQGILLATETPSGYTYAFDKGPTLTEVSLLCSCITKGEAVGITGTVKDMSPAQPNTPAVSDEHMTEWMEYLHMQQPMPHDAIGVPVHLYAEMGGTTYDIGETVSTCDGHFKYMWTPPSEGIYQIYATFDGSDSYYSSYGITALLVDKAPSPAGPIEPELPTEPPTEAPFITTEVAIIAAVSVAVVIGIAAFWALRKRK